MSVVFPRRIPPAAVQGRGWVLSALAGGVLSCNAILGIGEASLRCDTDPCTTDVASAMPGAAGDPGEPAAEGGARAGGSARDDAGAGGASSELGIAGAPVLQLPSGNSGSAAPEPASSDAGSGESAEPSSGGAAGAGAAGNAGAPQMPAASGGAGSALCNSGDACGVCICNECGDAFAACANTPGCLEIVACARINRCVGFDCYCGSLDPITCATNGPGNGPCVEETLAAPRSRIATLGNPSAGPASDAALAIATCSAQSNICTVACQN